MSQAERRIAHLDMDAFYASVELLRYPQLRGQAVVIGGRSALAPRELPDGTLEFARLRNYTGRGVVTTSTYEARALGVFSAMGMMKAARLAPDAFLLPADFTAYRHYSRLFKAAVAQLAPRIEDRGIDEIYIDLSEHTEPSDVLAKRLRDAVFEATGLSCSIGISPNKLLSKLASEFDKPGGITVLTEEDMAGRVWPLPVGKVNGIGPRANERLQAMGIQTIGELAHCAPERLQQAFGLRQASWLLQVAWGRDDRPVQVSSEPKSVSRETTFERDLHVRHDRRELGELFTRLCQRLESDLATRGLAGRNIGVKLRFDDFRTVTRDVTLPEAVHDAAAIRRAAGSCLKRVDFVRRLRLLGVRVGSLQARGPDGMAHAGEPVQLSLYDTLPDEMRPAGDPPPP